MKVRILLGLAAFLFGLFFAYCEVKGTFEFLSKDQGELNYIVFAGSGIAAAIALLPSWASVAWHGRPLLSIGLWVLFIVALGSVVASGLARTGSSTDQAQEGRETVEKRRVAAADERSQAERDLATAETAVATARQAVVDKSPTRDCKSGCIAALTAAVARAEADLVEAKARNAAAIAAAGAAPPKKFDALARRISALLPISEDSVRTYQPIIVPALTSALSALLTALGVWSFGFWSTPRFSRSRAAGKADDVVAASNVAIVTASGPAQPLLADMRDEEHEPRSLYYSGPATPLSEFALSSLVPASAHEEVHMRNVASAYAAHCERMDREMPSLHVFARELAEFCGSANVEVRVDGRDVFLRGARLVA